MKEIIPICGVCRQTETQGSYCASSGMMEEAAQYVEVTGMHAKMVSFFLETPAQDTAQTYAYLTVNGVRSNYVGLNPVGTSLTRSRVDISLIEDGILALAYKNCTTILLVKGLPGSGAAAIESVKLETNAASDLLPVGTKWSVEVLVQ